MSTKTKSDTEVVCKLANTPLGWVVIVVVNGVPRIASAPEKNRDDAITLAKIAINAAADEVRSIWPDGRICMIWHDLPPESEERS